MAISQVSKSGSIPLKSPPWQPVLSGILKKVFCAALLALGSLPFGQAIETPKRDFTISATYVDDGNALTDQYQNMTLANHAEYANNHGSKFLLVTDNLLVDQCKNPNSGKMETCAPYWNKVKMIMNWLDEPAASDQEEWLFYGDDDGIYANREISPSEVIDQLQKKYPKASIIIAKDVQNWTGSSERSVNTGFMIFRKDEASRQFLNKWWKEKDTATASEKHRIWEKNDNEICPTLGLCKNQNVLHEQQAFANVLEQNRNLIGNEVAVVDIRTPDRKWGVNAFKRDGCFIRMQKNWGQTPFSYDGDKNNPNGAGRKGDFYIQAAGVPRMGRYCHESSNTPAHPLRKEYVQKMWELVGNKSDFQTKPIQIHAFPDLGPILDKTVVQERVAEILSQRNIDLPDSSLNNLLAKSYEKLKGADRRYSTYLWIKEKMATHGDGWLYKWENDKTWDYYRTNIQGRETEIRENVSNALLSEFTRLAELSEIIPESSPYYFGYDLVNLGHSFSRAAENGNLNIVKGLIGHSLFAEIPVKRLEEGFAEAVRFGHLETVNALIASSRFAEISVETLKKSFERASFHRYEEIVDALIASPRFTEMNVNPLEGRLLSFSYDLVEAAREGDLDKVTTFMKSPLFAKIDLHFVSTSFLSAYQKDHTNVVTAMMYNPRFAEIDPFFLGACLGQAAIYDNLDMANAMIGNSRFAEIPATSLGESLVHASRYGSLDVTNALIASSRFSEIPESYISESLEQAGPLRKNHPEIVTALKSCSQLDSRTAGIQGN